MKKLLFVCGAFFSTGAFSQVQEKLNMIFRQNTYDVVIYQSDTSTYGNFEILESPIGSTVNMSYLIDSISNNGEKYIAFNAAPVDETGKLLGLYIRKGKKYQTINTGSGNGNFFLQPNGFWAVDKKGFEIKQSSKYSISNNYHYALQSGPMLLIDGKINPSFDPNSQNRNIRMGIGSFANGTNQFIVIIRSQTSVTFYEFAALFKDKYKCLNALYLDGGGMAVLGLSSGEIKGMPDNLPRLLLLKIN